MDLAAELQKIYASEINVEISWLWDGGIEVTLGDRLNGFLAETNVTLVANILPWLQEAIAHFYPCQYRSEREPAKRRKRGPSSVGQDIGFVETSEMACGKKAEGG